MRSIKIASIGIAILMALALIAGSAVADGHTARDQLDSDSTGGGEMSEADQNVILGCAGGALSGSATGPAGAIGGCGFGAVWSYHQGHIVGDGYESDGEYPGRCANNHIDC